MCNRQVYNWIFLQIGNFTCNFFSTLVVTLNSFAASCQSSLCTSERLCKNRNYAPCLHPAGQRPTDAYVHGSVNVLWDRKPRLYFIASDLTEKRLNLRSDTFFSLHWKVCPLALQKHLVSFLNSFTIWKAIAETCSSIPNPVIFFILFYQLSCKNIWNTTVSFIHQQNSKKQTNRVKHDCKTGIIMKIDIIFLWILIPSKELPRLNITLIIFNYYPEMTTTL